LTTGRIWLKLEEVVRMDLQGTLPPYLLGKDLILYLLGKLGQDGGIYKVFEFYDRIENRLSMDSRFTISNMIVEGGGKAGIFVPDEITADYLNSKETPSDPTPLPDSDALYQETWEIEVSDLVPQVALPSSPTNTVPVAEAEGEPLDQVYIGSCTGGRLEDLRLAASILKGKKRTRYTKLIVIPSSQNIYLEALRAGYLETLAEAGAAICNPSCGPCGKIDKGIMAEGESCAATSNRNFEGRMGELGSRVFLVSTLTAAASALEGKLVDPRKYL
jgi:3-isopropylmalate/(R)-2-methylmalate dehydratase large subunit